MDENKLHCIKRLKGIRYYQTSTGNSYKAMLLSSKHFQQWNIYAEFNSDLLQSYQINKNTKLFSLYQVEEFILKFESSIIQDLSELQVIKKNIFNYMNKGINKCTLQNKTEY